MAVLHRVVVNVIDETIAIVFIANGVFPKAWLPDVGVLAKFCRCVPKAFGE